MINIVHIDNKQLQAKALAAERLTAMWLQGLQCSHPWHSRSSVGCAV